MGWQVMYMNVMKVDCPSNYQVSFKILMEISEWARLTYYYQQDEQGNYTTNTEKLVHDCEDLYGFYKKCTVTLGYLDNYKELGLSEP